MLYLSTYGDGCYRWQVNRKGLRVTNTVKYTKLWGPPVENDQIVMKLLLYNKNGQREGKKSIFF